MNGQLFNDDFENPFAPENQRPSNNTANSEKPGPASSSNAVLENYNPFEESGKPTVAAKSSGSGQLTSQQTGGGAPAQQQSVQQKFSSFFTPETKSSGGGDANATTISELERRQKELDERSAALDRRDEEHSRLQRQERGSGSAGGGAAGAASNSTAKNWPPLPKFIPIQPCFFQDIEMEIPVRHQRIVRWGYVLWVVQFALLFLNIIGAVVNLAVATDATTAGTVLGVALLVFLLLVPLSYICWFRPLYKAFRSDSSFNFFVFFIVFAIQCIILLIQTLGINYLGSCGWINSFSTMRINTGAGLFMLVIALSFSALLAVSVVLLIRVHRLYRSGGGSMEKARAEFGANVATNETARNFAGAAVSETIRMK